MSESQNIIGYAKKVHFQEANFNLFMPEKSHVVQAELEKLGHIPYSTIHLGRDQKTEQGVEACQSIEQQGVKLQSEWQISGDVLSYKISSATSHSPFSEAGQQSQTSSKVKKSVGLQKTSNNLTALVLSSSDLVEVESYPKDKLTLDSLPNILKQIKKKRAILKHNKGDSSPQQSQSNMASRDDVIGEKKSTERNLEGLDTVRKPLVSYEYDLSSGESSAGSEREGKSSEVFHKKERHFSESPCHLSKFDSDSESESDYDVEEVPFPCAEDQSVLEKKRRTPILQNIRDFLGYFPVVLPHCCSLCDKTIDTLQDWNQHTNDPLHKLRCLLLQRVYPDWDPGELPAAKKNPFDKGKISTDELKNKVKMKTNADIPVQSRRENLAFLKMDSEMACNNVIEHFKKKPLFYGRLLTVDISSSQIQPLLKKPSAKIEELLNKVNQAEMSTKECFLGPILKDKPDNLKKHLMSEREIKSSESSEREESHSSDESSEATDWKSTRADEIMQQRNRESHGLSHEIMEHQSHTRRLQSGDPARVMWRDDIARSEWWEGYERECRTSHGRAQQRGNVERDEWRSSSEKGDWEDSGEIWEWRASIESDSGVHGGSSERAMRGVSKRVEDAWGVSSSSKRREWGSGIEKGDREGSEIREWETDDTIESAEWENYKRYISKDIKDAELKSDGEKKSEKVQEETPIPFLESDLELEDLMEKYESDDGKAELEDTQYEAKHATKGTENQTVAERDLQQPISLKKQKENWILLDNQSPRDLNDATVEKFDTKFGHCMGPRHVNQDKTGEPGRVVYVGDLVPGRCTNGDLIHLAKLFGKISNILLIKGKGEGFVEMYNSADAQAMVRCYKAKPPVIQGNIIKVELSQKYKKLHLKFPGTKPTGGFTSSFGASQQKHFGAPQGKPGPEEDILAPTSTPTLAELRAKYSTQLLRWANVPIEGNMPTKDKRWNPQTYEGKELGCFRFLPYAFKIPMLETHEQYLRSFTGTPDMFELDTPKIDEAFLQLLMGKKVVSSREHLELLLGEPERVLYKAQSKVAEIVGPLMFAI
ncbi:uncharacterized protein LOC134349911 [Mobula hypostoma]|uniref:uncharacterized protein LOC134349911 n=1 Tax=Mobula hypostoma TaxID=723540 RepID=UPI002FC34EC4